MQITIDIPQEFVHHFAEDKFADSLQRLKSDAHLLAGCYEKELIDMLIVSFKNSKVKTGKEEAKSALPTPPHPRWKPKMDQRYYYIIATGDPTSAGWIENAFDYGRYDIGNIFKSKDEAGFTVERLKVLAEMQEWAGKWNDEFSIRLEEDSGIEAYFHVFSEKSYGEMRFATKEDVQNCIKTVGEDRIKKYYFMIPEDKSNA